MKILFESDSFTIVSTQLRKNIPKINGMFFLSIKNAVFALSNVEQGLKNTKKNTEKGKIKRHDYDLSLVFVGKDKMRQLNKTYRKKDYVTDILSFEVDKENGEIYVHYPKAKSKAAHFDTTTTNYMNYLFVHGLAHLARFDHESEKEAEKMQEFEKKICNQFKIDVSSIHNS